MYFNILFLYSPYITHAFNASTLYTVQTDTPLVPWCHVFGQYVYDKGGQRVRVKIVVCYDRFSGRFPSPSLP